MSFIRQFLKNLDICVFVDNEECEVVGKIIKGGSSVGSIAADFEISEEHIDFKFNEYIKKSMKKAHSTYVAMLLSGKKQWALPVNDHDGYNKFGVNYNEVNVVKMPGGWSIFIPKDELEIQRDFLNGLKLDLLYSPYALLYDKICEFKADDRVTLYVYAQKTSCAIMIFAGLEMLFGAFFNEEIEEQMQEDETIAPINIADIDNIIAKEDDKFAALNALSDLDSDSEFSEGSSCELFEDITKVEDEQRSDEQIEESLQKVGRSGNILNNIKEVMKEYYKNPLYKSDFIEKVVVFDSQNVIDDQNFIDIVGHEIFIEAAVFKVNRTDDMISIIARELNQRAQ